jgi:hypothetical protein
VQPFRARSSREAAAIFCRWKAASLGGDLHPAHFAAIKIECEPAGIIETLAADFGVAGIDGGNCDNGR